MFNFLVSGIGWSPARDTLDRTRLFEHTDELVAASFKDGDAVSFDRLLKHPAVFASESRGPGSQLARVGRIDRAAISRGVIDFEYTLFPEIAPIPNTKLEELKKQLRINDWELGRTHWAVKDVDLFEVLMRFGPPNPIAPTAFKLNGDVDRKLLSVMMPFNRSYDDVFKAVQSAAAKAKFRCLRADNIWKDSVIIQDVVNLISGSGVVLCDFTGKNANVLYEMGIAHTIGRDVIMIAQHESDIPFDLRHHRFVRYFSNEQGLMELSDKVAQRLETILSGDLRI